MIAFFTAVHVNWSCSKPTVTFTGDKPGSLPITFESGVDSCIGVRSWGMDATVGAAVNVDMTTLFPACWVVGIAGGVPQEVRTRRNNPANRKIRFLGEYSFMLTPFPVLICNREDSLLTRQLAGSKDTR